MVAIGNRAPQVSQLKAPVPTEPARRQHPRFILVPMLSERSAPCHRARELQQDLQASSVLPLQCVPLALSFPSDFGHLLLSFASP